MSQSDETPEGLDPDEPHTPLWFTALGLCLLLLGGLFVLAMGEDEESPKSNSPGQDKEAQPDTPKDTAAQKAADE